MQKIVLLLALLALGMGVHGVKGTPAIGSYQVPVARQLADDEYERYKKRADAFFDRGDDERALNRLLQACGVERICLDSRALFACRDDSPAVVHAQTRKPRLPVRPTAFSDSPQLRFVGDPQLDANDPFLAPWVAKVAGWIEQGLRPCVFMHTADNRQAPLLAGRFHQLLTQRLPGLPELEPFTAPQLALL